jgi:hypothetical protein
VQIYFSIAASSKPDLRYGRIGETAGGVKDTFGLVAKGVEPGPLYDGSNPAIPTPSLAWRSFSEDVQHPITKQDALFYLWNTGGEIRFQEESELERLAFKFAAKREKEQGNQGNKDYEFSPYESFLPPMMEIY